MRGRQTKILNYGDDASQSQIQYVMTHRLWNTLTSAVNIRFANYIRSVRNSLRFRTRLIGQTSEPIGVTATKYFRLYTAVRKKSDHPGLRAESVLWWPARAPLGAASPVPLNAGEHIGRGLDARVSSVAVFTHAGAGTAISVVPALHPCTGILTVEKCVRQSHIILWGVSHV